MQNAAPPNNNRNFGNRAFNSNGSNQNTFGNSFSDRFDQSNQNFYDDFDLNEFAKNINNFDRPGNNRPGNFGGRQDFGGGSSGSGSDNFGNSNWKTFNPRSGNTSFGTNNRFNNGNNGNNSQNFQNNEDTRSGHHCIHMRGLPYYTDEMDVFNVSRTELK